MDDILLHTGEPASNVATAVELETIYSASIENTVYLQRVYCSKAQASKEKDGGNAERFCRGKTMPKEYPFHW